MNKEILTEIISWSIRNSDSMDVEDIVNRFLEETDLGEKISGNPERFFKLECLDYFNRGSLLSAIKCLKWGYNKYIEKKYVGIDEKVKQTIMEDTHKVSLLFDEFCKKIIKESE